MHIEALPETAITLTPIKLQLHNISNTEPDLRLILFNILSTCKKKLLPQSNCSFPKFIVDCANAWKEITVMLALFARHPHYAVPGEVCKRRFHQ